jgi:hypothetical protein
MFSFIRESYLVAAKSLLSSVRDVKGLDPAATSSEVYERARALMEQVNGALAISHHNAGVVRVEAVAEIMSDGTSRRHVFVQIAGAKVRSKVGAVGVAIGPDGKPVPPPPPEPSNAQRWLSIAAEDDLLSDALTYFARGDDWFDVYKALECLEMRFRRRAKRPGREVSRPRLGGSRQDQAAQADSKLRTACKGPPAGSTHGADGSARTAGAAVGSRIP